MGLKLNVIYINTFLILEKKVTALQKRVSIKHRMMTIRGQCIVM